MNCLLSPYIVYAIAIKMSKISIPRCEVCEMAYKITPIPDSYAGLAEGPHWDIETQSLYYVDLNNAGILRYDFEEKKMYRCHIMNVGTIGFIIPIEDFPDQFLIGADKTVAVITWNGKSRLSKVDRILFEVENNHKKYDGNRFNDGKCDPCGRLYAGTMCCVGDVYAKRLGNLYRYSAGGQVDIVKHDVGISNGLCWNVRDKKFYFADTADYDIKEFQWDSSSGDIRKPKILIDFHGNLDQPKFNPDGMTIDTDGFIYISTFGGSCVFKVNPKDGSVDKKIDFPCEQITSCCFGGPNLDILFVTTAAIEKLIKKAPAGTVYQVTGLGSKGFPMKKVIL